MERRRVGLGRRVAPGHTVRGAHGTLVVPAAEMRDFLGLFGDTSQDSVVEDISAFAQEKIGDYVGAPVAAVSIVDYYPSAGPGDTLYLSQPEAVSEIVQVGWRPEVGDVQPYVSDQYLLDESVSPVQIVLRATAPSPEAMSSLIAHPIEVHYTTDGLEGLGREEVRMAIMLVVQTLYYARGEGMPDAHAIDRIVAFACRSLQRGAIV